MIHTIALLTLGIYSSLIQGQTATRPNIVILLADDLGYADVGFHGCKDIPTPHLDSLSSTGVRFPQGYVSGVYCSPTRAGLLTGKYQQRFGHEFNPGGREQGLPLSETTLADRLKKAGYATGLVGKWHLGALDKYHPQERGFDDFFGFLGGAHTYFAASSKTILRGKQPVAEAEYLTDAFGREAVAFIEKNRARPFFLYLAFNAVHTPMNADEARLKKFAHIGDKTRRSYAAMLSALDDQVGRVMEKIRSAGLEENTLFFFFSDNGGPTMKGVTINGSVNTPLRGSKRTTLEGGIRVPFVVRWKGKLPAGVVRQEPVIQLDVHATALAAAQVAIQPGMKLDGVNLLPLLENKTQTQPHEALYWRMGEQAAIRKGDWKLVKYDRAAEGEKGLSPFKLYDLAKDLGETKDLAGEKPEIARDLESAWKKWEAQMVPPGGRKK